MEEKTKNDIVAENIKRIRLEKKISQRYIAEKMFVHKKSFWLVERGQTPITINRLFTLAEILGVTIKDLMEGTE